MHITMHGDQEMLVKLFITKRMIGYTTNGQPAMTDRIIEDGSFKIK